MAKSYAKAFYASRAWRVCRAGYIAERIGVDGGMCELCRERLGYIVHHKILLTPQNIQDPEVSLCFLNLQYVCKPCHDRLEGHLRPGELEEAEYVFTADGDIVERIPPGKKQGLG